MNITIDRDKIKSQSKALHAYLKSLGCELTHSQAMEAAARLYANDWNTLSAMLNNEKKQPAKETHSSPVEPVCVVTIRDDVVDEVTLCRNAEEAERVFLNTCEQRLSNFDEYTTDDIEAILDNGYESYGAGTICITTPDATFDLPSGGCEDDQVILNSLKSFEDRGSNAFYDSETDSAVIFKKLRNGLYFQAAFTPDNMPQWRCGMLPLSDDKLVEHINNNLQGWSIQRYQLDGINIEGNSVAMAE